MEALGISRHAVFKVRKKYNESKNQNILNLLQAKPRPSRLVKR